MRIIIIAPGSQGDVQPFLALGKGLIKAGYDVQLVSNRDHEEEVKKHGIKFWSVEVNMEDIIRTKKMREALESGKLLRSMRKLGKELELNAALLCERSLDACKGADMIMAGISGLFTAHSIAEKLEIPFIQALNIPFSPTKSFSGVLFPKMPFKSLSHKLTQQMVWQAYRPTDAIVRQQVLNLPKSSFFGPFKSNSFNNVPIIYGFSPSVIPRPKDWGDNIHITGFWTLDPPENWKPPSIVTEFLEEGSNPIYIGFGSMSNRKPEETTNLVLEALKLTNQRAIILSGWGGLTKTELPNSILMVDSIPHSWLFPRVKAVIHHGGAGTTAAGLVAGIPSILVPFHGDQPFWGRLISKLGVGPDPIPRKKLTSKKLAKAINQVISNQELLQRATNIGIQIRKEDGIKNTIETIKKVVNL